MSRQHAVPVLVPADGGAAKPLRALGYGAGPDAFDEARLRDLVFDQPQVLPIARSMRGFRARCRSAPS